VVSPDIAHASPLPAAVLTRLSSDGGPCGAHAASKHRQDFERLLQQVQLAEDDVLRAIPQYQNALWFCKALMGDSVTEEELLSADVAEVYSKSTNLLIETPIFLLASVDRMREEFFTATTHEVRGVQHILIGKTGIQCSRRTRCFVCRLIFKGMLMNEPVYDLQSQWLDIEGVDRINLSDTLPRFIDNCTTRANQVRKLVRTSFLSDLAGYKKLWQAADNIERLESRDSDDAEQNEAGGATFIPPIQTEITSSTEVKQGACC